MTGNHVWNRRRLNREGPICTKFGESAHNVSAKTEVGKAEVCDVFWAGAGRVERRRKGVQRRQLRLRFVLRLSGTSTLSTTGALSVARALGISSALPTTAALPITDALPTTAALSVAR